MTAIRQVQVGGSLVSEVKGYAYCHTFSGHELELRIVACVRKRDVSTTDKMVQSCCAFGCTNRSGEGKKSAVLQFS